MRKRGWLFRLFNGGTLGERVEEHSTWLGEIVQRLAEVERLTEATRQKVYREDKQTEAEKLIAQAKPAVQPQVPQFAAGDSVPPEFMKIFGG